MATMKLGNYTFEWNPKSASIDIVRPKVVNATVETYGGIAYFSWGPQLQGARPFLEWDHMTTEQFNSLDSLYQADAQVVWDLLGDGTLKYNVILYNLEGKYFIKYDTNNYYRQEVKLELIVMSKI